jgi:rhamnulose-1-phosphate aldolase
MVQGAAMITVLEETRDFKRAAEVLFARGWAEASAGNMSLRLAAGAPAAGGMLSDPHRVQEAAVDMTDLVGDRFLVTASGSRMRDLAVVPEKCLCLIQVLDRNRLWLVDGSGPLSSEWPTHAGLHSLFKESRSRERAVLHCHPLNLIALSHIFVDEKEMNDRLFRMHPETRLCITEMLGLIPYGVTGTKELAKASREKLKKYRIALWDKHGVIASGSSLDKALDRIEMVEKAAAIYLLLKSAGVEPAGLSDEQVAATMRAFKK